MQFRRMDADGLQLDCGATILPAPSLDPARSTSQAMGQFAGCALYFALFVRVRGLPLRNASRTSTICGSSFQPTLSLSCRCFLTVGERLRANSLSLIFM
jgi:hypothetical protein